MVRSMTGYGRGEANNEQLSVTVELKSVNHRFFEASVRSPRQFAFLEDKLKSYVQSRVARGKIDIMVSCDFGALASDKIEVNEVYAEEYISALKSLAEKFDIVDDISVSSVARNQDVFCITKQSLDEEAVWLLVSSAAEIAVDNFIKEREAEGQRLADDVISRTQTILGYVEKVEERSPQTVKEYRERIEKKMRDLLGDTTVDEQRLITETAIFADRVAVNEETVRLRSHIAHFSEMCEAGGVIGKKLDFTVQEMNRETNTIGSKCQDIELSHIVVEIKSEIEKIREQIQNIE
ncbi:MAG: YicC family protein [Clostridia bacterium]|nr:YicC family protein [Clostridia bacterium]